MYLLHCTYNQKYAMKINIHMVVRKCPQTPLTYRHALDGCGTSTCKVTVCRKYYITHDGILNVQKLTRLEGSHIEDKNIEK